MTQELWLMQRCVFFWYWSFVINDCDVSVSVTWSLTHFHSIPGKWPLCAKTCHPTDKLISLFPRADWPHLTLGFFFHVKRCEMRHLKLIKEGKITLSHEATMPLRWLCSPQLVGYSTWLTEGVLDPRSSTPPQHTHTHTLSPNNRGPNVGLEFICTVHVDRFAIFHVHTCFKWTLPEDAAQ